MESPSSLHTPLLRVSRPVSACSRCRSAKVKCDGKLPACSACERSGKAHECNGGSDQFARGKERSYVASLESRIEKLEKKLAQLSAASNRRGSVAMIDAAGGGKPDAEKISAAKEKVQKKKAEAEGVEDLVSDFGYLTINACTKDFSRSTNEVGNVAFHRIILKASLGSKSLNHTPRAGLPERHVAHQLVQHYFDKIFPLFPCLSETAFYISLDNVYQSEQNSSNFDNFVVYMVLAVGTMSLSRERESPAAMNAACFLKAALQYADGVISPAHLMGIQATLLLLQYSILEPSHLNSWYLIGAASRIAIDIGIHRETARTLKMKSNELDLRRRIFYCVYTYDRAISMVLQRPFSFSDDSVDVQIPRVSSDEKDSALGSWNGTLVPMAAATHLFKLRRLQSEWYQDFYHTGDIPMKDFETYCKPRRDALSNWFKEIPTTISQVIRDWLTLEYHYIQVYLSAPSPKIPQPSDEAWRTIFTHAVSYSVRFADILSDINHRIMYTFHDALRTYYVGRNLLQAIWDKEDKVLDQNNIAVATNAIKATISILSAMTKRWEDAQPLVEQFSRESSVMLTKLSEKSREIDAARERARLEKEQAAQKKKQQQQQQQQQAQLEKQQQQQQKAYEQQQQHHHHQQQQQKAYEQHRQQQLNHQRLQQHHHHQQHQERHPHHQHPHQLPHLPQRTPSMVMDENGMTNYDLWSPSALPVSTPMSSSIVPPAMQQEEIFFSHLTTADFGNVAFYRYV